MAEMKHSKHNLVNGTIKSGKLVIVGAGSFWCGVCHIVAFIVSKIVEEVGKINVDETQELAPLFQLTDIPGRGPHCSFSNG